MKTLDIDVGIHSTCSATFIIGPKILTSYSQETINKTCRTAFVRPVM